MLVGIAKCKPLRAIIVDDVHDNNLLFNYETGQSHIIDASTRELTPEEVAIPRIAIALKEAEALAKGVAD